MTGDIVQHAIQIHQTGDPERFNHVAAGRIRIEIDQRYDLRDAGRAYRNPAPRKMTGSFVI